EVRHGGGYLLVATDIAARGVDLPETTHIYNFELPKDAVHYLHRAGRTVTVYLKKPMELPHCICGTLEPGFTCLSLSLSCGQNLKSNRTTRDIEARTLPTEENHKKSPVYLNIAISEGDTAAKVVSASKMSV
ncbi:hypothetical protein RJ639_041644, partial [Escallonia herrerae]